MAVTQRRLIDNFVGTLKNGCTALDTSISSDAFGAATFPSDLSTTQAMPMVIADDSQGLYEIVLVTAHSAATTTATVIRGAQGTTARQWTAGAILRVSVTRRDLVDSMTKSVAVGLGDTHAGMEIVDTATGVLSKQTANQGFQPLAHVVQGGIGTGINGAVATSRELLFQTGYCSGNPSVNGYINWDLPAGAFPNSIVAVIATPMTQNTEAGYFATYFASFTNQTGGTTSVNGPTLQFRLLTYNNLSVGTATKTFSILAIGV